MKRKRYSDEQTAFALRQAEGSAAVAYQAGERRTCSAMGFGRSSRRNRSCRDPQAAVRVRHGYRRLHVLLRREGWVINHRRVHRLYAEEGLSIRTKLPRRKRAWRTREGRPAAEAANEVWAELPRVPPAQPAELQRRGWTSCRTSCSTAARPGS